MRGNFREDIDVAREGGHIPARVGEPSQVGVDPRAYGGILLSFLETWHFKEVHPARAGIIHKTGEVSLILGPIPARMGESQRRSQKLFPFRAYPRAYGGIHSELIVRLSS